MGTLHYAGASAPGLAASEQPTRDDARELGSEAGTERNRTADSDDCASVEASKLIATAIARAALLGIEVCELDGGGWLLRNARGGDIGTVSDISSLSTAVGGFEAARDDVRDLVRRMAGAPPSKQGAPAESVAALKARANRAGFELQHDVDRFTITRWGRSVDLADAAAVSAFLDRVRAGR